MNRATRLSFCAAAVAVLSTSQVPLCGQEAKPAGEWHSLFDGKSLAGWKESDFFGSGKVTVENGAIVIGYGALTGITWAGESAPFGKADYEVRVEAARIKGMDFFAGITFPVGDSFCTWINGGWGGLVVGLSSINGADASQNETTFDRKFETGRYYLFRLRVTAEKIMAWIDEELVIDFTIGKKWIALREASDMERAVPFGIAAYATVSSVRKIEWRRLPEAK